jgi:copper(I)-binding protein
MPRLALSRSLFPLARHALAALALLGASAASAATPNAAAPAGAKAKSSRTTEAAETAAPAPKLSVHSGWIRITPPGAATTGAYAELHNDGKAPLVVTSVAIAGAERAELHESFSRPDGAMGMRRVERLEIAPGQTATLAPGGMHLMVYGLKSALKAGDAVELAVTLANGATVPAQLTAREQ